MGDRLEGALQERWEVCDVKKESQHQQKEITTFLLNQKWSERQKDNANLFKTYIIYIR